MNTRIFLNNDWQFSPTFSQEMLLADFGGHTETVRIPHTFFESPFNSFSPEQYQKEGLYRRTFITQPQWHHKIVLLTIEAAAHYAEVFLNGALLSTHSCGYTAFTTNLTPHLAPEGKENVLCVKVNSYETLNQPPFGYMIDYMTYGGIYRDVYLDVKNAYYIEDIFVHTERNTVSTEISLNDVPKGYTLHQALFPSLNAPIVGDKTVPCAELFSGVQGKVTKTTAQASGIALWSLESPALYTLHTELKDTNGAVVDSVTTRFGFRDIRFDETGFYLNGKKIKLRGLNRHQSYAHLGYALPKNVQRDDADILKYELGLNEVRTSHYPQSKHFIDRCDEIGLLVFTEIPGWQHIGDDAWKNIAVQNVHEMVTQYRNHPSIFLWGVRINESVDDDAFYEKTNRESRTCDPYRPTAGVRYLKNSHLLEDVYTFNDFSFSGKNDGCLPKAKVTTTHGGYMITEFNGHMFPTKRFDNEAHRTEHALRHAKVLDAMYAQKDIAGASGWCAFDYNTHKDFGSGDYICYHGVMDMFRNPKPAAFVYQSQQEIHTVGAVLEVTSDMNIGEYPGGNRGDVYILTNAESVKLYANDIFIKEYTKKDSPFPNLPHGPILVNDFIGHRPVDEDNIPERSLATLKEVLYAIQKYGVDNLPLAYKRKGARLFATKVVTMDSMWNLYGKYIGNWGREAITYRFDAYSNGTVVKSVIKTASTKAFLCATPARAALIEDESYDASLVRLTAIDEYNNCLPYVHEAVNASASGAISILGPSLVSLKGGAGGLYVCTNGTEGQGILTLTDWTGTTQTLTFSVTKAHPPC